MNPIRKIAIGVWTICFTSQLMAQTVQALKPGDPCPDLAFSQLLNYRKQAARLSDFNGKWVILDFWDTSCSPCIAAMPGLDTLQRVFSDQLQILAVGKEKAAIVQKFLDRTKAIKGFDYRFAFETGNRMLDSVFPHGTVPHTVWISPERKVHAISTSSAVTAENIRNVLAGKPMEYVPKIEGKDRNIDWNDPLALRQLAEPIYFRDNTSLAGEEPIISMITPFIPDVPSKNQALFNAPTIVCSDALVFMLYLCAQNLLVDSVNMTPNRILFETKDSVKLRIPVSQRGKFAEYLYCYGQALPSYTGHYDQLSNGQKQALKVKMGKRMMEDLETFFGYQASLQRRARPCQVFRIVDASLLKTAGGTAAEEIGPGYLGATFTHTRLSKIVETLGEYYLKKMPYFNETGIDPVVDMQINAKLTERDNVAKELKRYGISLEVEEREMTMLVVEDK